MYIQSSWAFIGMVQLKITFYCCGSHLYIYIYMVKFKIIARHPTTLGWVDWRFDDDYDGYDTVNKAVDACRKQQESFPEPWQFSINGRRIWLPNAGKRFASKSLRGLSSWQSELTSEKPERPGQIPIWGDVNNGQFFFLAGCDIGTGLPGFDWLAFEYWLYRLHVQPINDSLDLTDCQCACLKCR